VTATLRLNLSKTIAILIFIACTIYLIHPAFAQDSTTSSAETSRKTTSLEQRIDTRIQKIDTRISSREAKMATREAALKAKLEAFRDKKKVEIATRVNTNLNKVNQNQTTLMQKHLDAMSTLLNKIEARVNQGTPDIKDPAGAKNAIADARIRIASASTAVKSQSEKDYTISVTSESKVRSDAQAKREELYKDIMALRKQIIDARQAVSNSIRVARSGTIIKEGTSSGQQ